MLLNFLLSIVFFSVLSFHNSIPLLDFVLRSYSRSLYVQLDPSGLKPGAPTAPHQSRASCVLSPTLWSLTNAYVT